jgi:predicted amidohydrolase
MIKVGFLQFEPKFGSVEDNLDRIERALKGRPADLVVLPELATTGYNFASRSELEALAEPVPHGPTVERLAALAHRENLHIVAGIAERAGSGPSARLYNSAALLTPRGLAGLYRKVHLFDRETLLFDPGDRGFPVFPLDGPGEPKIGIMICFDWRFPEAARSLALAGADVIAHPSNLLKPYCQAAMITRCLENRVFAVTANRTGAEDRGGVRLAFTGRSQIVDPDGIVLATADAHEELLAVASIDIGEARRKGVNAHNDVMRDRRPDLYRLAP